MIGVIARQDDGLHPRSPGSFAQLIRRWNQRCLNYRDNHPKFNQKQQKKSRRKRKKHILKKKTTSQIYQHSHGRKKSTSQKKPSKTKEQHQQQINQTHNRAGCVIFYTLVPFLKFHSKTTTTNRDLESILSQLFSHFSSLKLRKCRPESGWTFFCRAVILSLPSRYNNNNENTIAYNNYLNNKIRR